MQTSYTGGAYGLTSLGSSISGPSSYPMSLSSATLSNSPYTQYTSSVTSSPLTASSIRASIPSLMSGYQSSTTYTNSLPAYEVSSPASSVYENSFAAGEVPANDLYTGANNARWENLRDSYYIEPTAPANMHALITKHLLNVGTWFPWFVQGAYIRSAQGFLGVVPPSGYNYDGSPIFPVVDEDTGLPPYEPYPYYGIMG